MTPMQILLSTLGILFVIAFLVERWSARAMRLRRERDRRREIADLNHITLPKQWWKEDDERDQDY